MDPWDKEIFLAAIESGADGVIIPPGKSDHVKKLGILKTISEDGDFIWERDVVTVEVASTEDLEKAARESLTKRVIVKTKDWRVIPLENLVATGGMILAEVGNLEEAELALGILERGVYGIVVTAKDPSRIREIVRYAKEKPYKLGLSEFEIEEVKPIGMGDRVCVDTCSNMSIGEGLLVGNSSSALFLIHSESAEGPYVSPRPFRVNAGCVHAYTLTPDGKTRYLAELKSGDTVLGINWRGDTFPLVVGRLKIERRPLLLIRAKTPQGSATTIVQNAETIRLVSPDGKAVSVVDLKKGHKVLGYTESGGRHFGHRVQETVLEK